VIAATDGLRNAAGEIRNFAGREIPMGSRQRAGRLLCSLNKINLTRTGADLAGARH
jgi:hypothetical protein